MEYYESKCGSCAHTWRWVGYKTGIGKTQAQLEEMRTAGTVCPRCGKGAQVGLDHTSESATALDGALSSVVKALVTPPNKPVVDKVTEAVNAERERCAQVAETWARGQEDMSSLKLGDDCPASAASHHEQAWAGRCIAHAIRKG